MSWPPCHTAPPAEREFLQKNGASCQFIIYEQGPPRWGLCCLLQFNTASVERQGGAGAGREGDLCAAAKSSKRSNSWQSSQKTCSPFLGDKGLGAAAVLGHFS